MSEAAYCKMSVANIKIQSLLKVKVQPSHLPSDTLCLSFIERISVWFDEKSHYK